MSHKELVIAAAVTIALGATPAMAAQVAAYQPVSSSGGNFTILTPDGSGATADNPNYDPYATSGPNMDPYIRGGAGYTFGHTNNVSFTWDGTLFNSSSDYTGNTSVSNATISSPTVLLGAAWTVHTIQFFGPGSYTFDATDSIETGMISMTVGANQIGAHMLFDWNGNLDIDVVNVWNLNSTFSNCGSASTDPYASNCLWTGGSNAIGNAASTVFMLASTDNDGDGTLGIPMVTSGPYGGGPFAGFNFNYNLHGTLTAVPIPGAAWLFGSGLLGLFGIARRKHAQAAG